MKPKTFYQMKNILLITLVSMLALPVMATIVFPPANLAEMAYNSDLVIYAKVESHQNGNSYINNFRVLEVIKGGVSKNDIVVVEEYSGENNGRRTVVSGDVDFQLGYNYVLFLSQVGTGNYKTRQLSMGVFEEGTLDNQSVIGRTGSILDIAIAGGTIYNYDELRGLYLTADFVNHMRAAMNGTANWNYQNAGFVVYDNTADISNGNNNFAPQGQLKAAGPCPNDAPCHCSTLFGPQGPNQTKFVDNNWTVCVAGDAATDPTNAGNITDLQTAITAMNGMVGINISYTGVDNACTTSCASGSAGDDALTCAGGFGNNCGKMYVFFDDPCMQIPDVDAQCSGTLGIGGHFAGGSHIDDCGTTWQTACNPFFVMNNFGGCAPNTVNQNDYIAVLIHEMLHAVGVGHHYDASAFTTTAAGDNACGAAGANNPVNAPTGMISHDGSECSGIMNPVICNSPAPAPPDFSITALDNSCTDWMYNITDASNCTITNVMVTNAVCNGDDLTFDVTFDYTDADEDADGNTTFSVELDGTPVATMQPITGNANTDVGQMYSVTVTGPTAGGMSTITIRNDAVFACTGDALNVDLPQCPTPCADNCADLMSMTAGDCGNTYYPDSGTWPATFPNAMANGGDGSGCQDYNAVPVVLPAGSGDSHTICTQYTAGSDAAAFIDFLVAGNPGCIDQSITLFEAATCTDASTLPGVTVTQPGGGFAGQATGLTGNTDYIICFTYTENGCADDFSGSIFEICPDIVEIGTPAIACASTDGSTVDPVCAGANFTVALGNPMTTTDQDGFLLVYDFDPATPETQQEIYDDIIGAVDDPDLVFFGEQSDETGAGFIDLAGFINNTCVTAQVDLYIVPADITNGGIAPDCLVEGPLNLIIYPNLMAMIASEDPANCGTLTANLMSEDGTLCATEMIDCANDGDLLSVTFDELTDGTPITDPQGCSMLTIASTIACADCTPVVCPIVTAIDTPANGCSSATAQTVCVTYDQDPTGLVTATINGITGTIDAIAMTICYDIPMENTTCDAVTLDLIHTATCDADNDAPILDMDGNDTNGSVGMITVFPVYQVTNPTDDSATCGAFTVNLMSSNTDGTPNTMCQTATLNCMTDNAMLTIDYTAAPDATTNPITTQITDANILACSGNLALTSGACAGCTTTVTTIDITDPCSCDAGIDVCGGAVSSPPGNIDLDGDGVITEVDYVADVITITQPAPAPGETWTVTNSGGALDCTGASIGNATLTDEGGGVYTIIIYYPANGTGFGTMTFTNGANNIEITNPSAEYEACNCTLCPTTGGSANAGQFPRN